MNAGNYDDYVHKMISTLFTILEKLYDRKGKNLSFIFVIIISPLSSAALFRHFQLYKCRLRLDVTIVLSPKPIVLAGVGNVGPL